MRSIRRVGGVAVAGLLLSALAASAATAQTAATYAGSATGYALKLTLANQGITAGSSAAKAASDGTGEATGAGVLAQANTTATAKNPPGETKPETCGDAQLDPVEAAVKNLVTLGLGCGTAAATGSGLTSVASANGKVGSLDVNLAGPLSVLPVQPAQITQPISDGLDQLCAAIPAPLKPTVCAVGDTVQTILQSVTTTKALGAEIGSSTSGVSVSGNNVTTEATASGAIIRIVPTPVLDGVTLPEALATITVSRANAKVVCDVTTAAAVPSFDPAIVRVKLSGPLAALLAPVPAVGDPIPALPFGSLPVNPIIGGTSDPTISLKDGEFTVTPGSSVTLFPGLPIESEIVVGNGSAKTNPDGTATAIADGVKIHLLKNIGATVAPLTGGLLANLTHTEAAGGCVAATVVTPAPQAPEVTRELPRTGGQPTPWLPIAGVAGLALAVMTRRALRTR